MAMPLACMLVQVSWLLPREEGRRESLGAREERGLQELLRAREADRIRQVALDILDCEGVGL